MLWAQALEGAQVRHTDMGTTGEIRGVEGDDILISWNDPDALLPRRVCYTTSDARLFDYIEVNLLDKGWVPLGSLLASDVLRAKRQQQLDQALEGKGDGHDPFRKSNRRGPGPRGRKDGQRKRDPEKCTSTGKYQQRCVSRGGGSRTIAVNKQWKRQYNKDWWRHHLKTRRE